ncbi:autotransporter secretion inner membrane protein TamB [Sphingomonas gellani]|uniref:Autotransporter secretion inner membrane protein TamB n=1 Tax=Sphingomonas gellani TaxID=1166340 RepID=A0A1H8F787_9SPHN|nr:translocation/assembly module TamB domain-containing protein [Sphingomonas gellani]SEN27254.1 autotransporter secretion inner membrane protein TamB [Sphingomonas gellani]
MLGALAGLIAILAGALLLLDTAPGHRFVAERIGSVRLANGLRFTVGRIDGSLFSNTQLSDLRVHDRQGLVFIASRVDLDWRPAAWLSNRLDVRSLVIPRAVLLRTPRTVKTGRQGPILPDFDIRIGHLSVGRLDLARGVLGHTRTGRLEGQADIRHGRALVALDMAVAGSDRLHLRLDAAPDRDRFDVDFAASGGAGGILSRAAGGRAPVALRIDGNGRWSDWRGRAAGRIGQRPVLDLMLRAQSGRYLLGGTITASPFLTGKLQRVTAPRMLVEGNATLDNRRLTGALAMRSAALAAQATGTLDLGRSALNNVRVRARLLRTQALFPNMSGRNVALRAILDGPIGTASFDYRLDADRFAFDDTGFENAHAAGQGRWGSAPVAVPVRFTASRVTGVGDVAGGILRNLSATGILRVTPTILTGDGLLVRSDKLTGRISLLLNLRSGQYQVGVNGALGRYLIPGLGVVDVQSQLRVVPGPGGHGTRVVGQGSAQVLRLDNAFFRSLAGGLPRIVTGLERGPDGVIRFTDLRLVAPSIRLQGSGFRRRDGTFHFEGTGQQASYGPLSLVLDGQIDHPTLDLRFARPNQALGLSDVRAHLAPTPQGFDFQAAGTSRLGQFTARGSILLPNAGDGQIVVDDLSVAGSHASGRIDIVPGGFDGKLAVTGGGLDGTVMFRPDGEVQRVEAHLDARGARLGNGVTLRQGRLDLIVRLDPAGTDLSATASGVGLRRGALSLARFAGSAKLVDGVGEVRASAASSRGRAFDLQTVIQVGQDSYSAVAQGNLDKRPLRLAEPARITRSGDVWRLSPTRLTFGTGEAVLSGSLGTSGTALDATLSRMPLALLDIGYPGLGLGGTASGRVRMQADAGAQPTGRVDLTVSGLTRSGLVLSSRPIDLALAGVLSADRLGVRAVAGSGGRPIGRVQALLSPLGSGGLAERILRAPLTAQLRYAGPADTLWRLTGVELFDLSGPVSIGADATGTLADPTIRGAVQASGARIESATTGTVLTDVRAAGRFAGSRLQIDSFAATAGKGGRVSGTGAFDFAGAHGIGLDIRLQADHAVMIARDDIGATVSGPLTFRSDGTGGTIAGDVVLDRSRYRLGQAAAASAAPRLNVREINLPPGADADDEAPAAPWRLAIHARARSGLRVSGLGLSSEWSADLQLGGAPDNPAISGRAALIRGDYEFAGREFELVRGVIRFDGQAPANPALDIEADATSTGLNASIRVTGNAFKPEVGFTSTPALPQDELLSRLLFGTSITNLSAPEALQLAAAVAALQDGGNGLNPINAVRRAAGLDRLRILPADPQTGQGTSIAAGKYVTRRLYAEIVTDGQGYSATNVEFQVTRWLSLLSSISTLGRTSGNVRVSRDY